MKALLVKTEIDAQLVAVYLVRSSKSFSFTPLPDDFFEFTVKNEPLRRFPGVKTYHPINCVKCGQLKTVGCTLEQYEQWYGGRAPIQQAMPDTPAEERELLISGICGECWVQMFKSEEAEEDGTEYESCPKCGARIQRKDAFEDEGEGAEAGRTFYYCSEHCRETH